MNDGRRVRPRGSGKRMYASPAAAVFRLANQRQRWRTLSWIAFFALLFGVGVYAYGKAFPDYFQRQTFAASVETNLAFRMLYGPPRDLDTPGGFIAWRYGFGSLVAAVWGLLTATSLLRGEEDAGRWEMVISGVVRRGTATGLVLGSILANLIAIAAVSWMILTVSGLGVGSSAFFVGAFFLPATTFVGVGAFFSQLAATRRSAAGIAGVILGVTFLARVVGNGARTFEWLLWLSPNGWFELSRAYTGSDFSPLLVGYGVSSALLVVAYLLSRRRDLGAGVLGGSTDKEGTGSFLGSPLGATIRQVRWGVIAWMSTMTVVAWVFGILSKDFVDFIQEQGPSLKQFMEELAGIRLDAAGFAGFLFSFAALPIGIFGALQLGPMREEEEEHRLDLVLSQPVSRTAWFLSRVGVATAAMVGLALTTAVGFTAGGAIRGVGLNLVEMTWAALNVLPVALLALAIGCAVFGFAPRLAVGVAVGALLSAYLLEFLGSLAQFPAWALSLSPFHHVRPYPALPANWTAIALMLLIAVMGVVGGGTAFRKRDISGA